MTRSKKKSSEQMKPATPAPRPVPPSDGPVFIAEWSDDTETRMSIYATLDDLDVRRAVEVSRAAYSSRHRVPIPAATIVEGRFEHGGTVIKTFSADELQKAVSQ